MAWPPNPALRYIGGMRGCLIAVLLVGCAPPPVITAEDAGAPPTLELSSSLIDAGQASLRFGQTVQREAVVSVRADAPLVLDVRATGPLTVTPSLTLGPNAWTEVPVVMSISHVGELRGVVSFSAPGVTPVSATVLGVGTEAPGCIVVEPSTIDFGTLNQGCPVAQRPVRISNECRTPRLLSDGEVDPFLEPFALSQLTSLPRRLEPGQSWSGLAEFHGGAPGRHEAALRFVIDGELGAVVGLRGFRSDSGPREFSITIPSPELDVLVVLDSSPSFLPRRATTEARVLSELGDFHLFPGPLRVGVVPTGGTQLVPSRGISFFESWTSTFATSLADALARSPSNGSEVERCIETAAQISASVPFWRASARRMAVCLTDAPEQSADVVGAMAVLADAGVRWNVVGPPLVDLDGGCRVEALDDGGYVMSTSMLAGTVTSICGSWHMPRFEPAPVSAMEYQLPFTPNFPITVWVDGAQLTESEWVWDAPRRTIQLLAAPLSTFVVRESLACPP